MLGLQHLHCRRIRPLLWDYATDRLPESGLEKVEAHLPACLPCRRELDALKRAQALLFAARSETPPIPKTGWHDLRVQITARETETETLPTAGFASSPDGSPSEQVAVVAGFQGRGERRAHRHIPRAASGWLPNLTLASAFAVFALTGAFAYRWFSNVPPLSSSGKTSVLKEAVNQPREATPANVPSAPPAVVMPDFGLFSMVNATNGEDTGKDAPAFARQAGRNTAGAASRALRTTLETAAYHPDATEPETAPVASSTPKPTKPRLHRIPKTEQSPAPTDDGKFHPYKGPEDKLPPSDPAAHRFPLDRIVPVSVERQGALAVGTAPTTASDDDRAY